MRKSTLSGICCILVAGVLTAGVCCAGYASRDDNGKWFKVSDIKKWHISDNSPADNIIGGDNKPNDGEVENGGNMIVNQTSSNLISMAAMPLMETGDDGIAVISEDSYVLTATNDSGDSSLAEYVWSATFENASSAWANGKKVTDYISISTSADTKQQTVRNLQAFGEPIIITVASKFNSDATATCKIDYVKRISSVTLKVNSNDCLNLGNVGNTYNLVPTYGTGTLLGEISATNVTVALSEQIQNDMAQGLGSYYGPMTLTSVTVATNYALTPYDFIKSSISGPPIYSYPQAQLAYNKMLNDASQSLGNLQVFYLTISVNYSYSYDGSTYQTGTTANKNIPYSVGDLTKNSVVANVALDKDHIVM